MAGQNQEPILIKADEHWMSTRWRPACAWLYIVTCTFDFVIFPILWSTLQSLYHGNVTLGWDPITLKGGGLYHVAMGAILGVSAWSRGQEKMRGVSESTTIINSRVQDTDMEDGDDQIRNR